MMTTPTVQELQTQLDTAQEQARQAEAELDRLRAEQQERRAAAQLAHAEEHYATYPAENERLMAEEQQAREAFRQAVLNSDITRTWLRTRILHWQRMALATTATNSASQIGEPPVADIAYRQPRLFEDMMSILDDTAKMSYDEALEAFTDERQQVGDAAAREVR